MSYVRHYKNNSFADDIVLPFRIQLSFKKLIRWWQDQAALPESFEASRAKDVLKRIEKIQEPEPGLDTIEWLEKNQEEIQLMLSPFFPSLSTTNETRAAGLPFQSLFFNLTKRFADLLESAEGDIQVPVRNPELTYMFGCIAILNTFYRANISLPLNLYFDIRDKKSGILHRYRVFINGDFAEILPLHKIEPLTENDIQELINNLNDAALWKKKIPPGSFSFEGFTIVTLFDVTREESVSSLKFDLLKKDALLIPEIVDRIGANLCAMLNIPDLKTGFVSYNKETGLLQSPGYGFWKSIVLSDKKKKRIDEAFCKYSSEFLFDTKQAFILPNVKEEPDADNRLIKHLVSLGIKSYLAVPLLDNNELIGILELGAEKPNVLNTITVHKLQEVLVVFTTALKRSQDEMKTQVEAVIRQKCTAIHPTVAWRFTEAAEHLLESQLLDNTDTMEDIVFADVYPMYGQADIQGSSIERSRSIQSDLVEQLTLAKNILDMSVKKLALPVYKDLQFRMGNYIDQLKLELSAGDENKVMEFLKEEIYPVFDHFHTLNSEIHEAVLDYEKKLDPALGLLYKRRKNYEQSVKLINENISGYLDKAQQAAQSMFPHYFEMYKTDGVEHNLYIGQSMVKNQVFHPLYLQNLRLWQLLVICEIENVVRNTRPQLATKLDICSLILVQSNPLSIRFRMEEKKFDVDGTYNIRYEIIKKRIDKASVKETNERLTQPGKIAIVYSQDKEAKEYLNYFRYLQSINYIGPDIEWLNLKDMQGVTGLKALRIDVVYNQKFPGIKESKAVQILEEIGKN
jgi:hypothetical protein